MTVRWLLAHEAADMRARYEADEPLEDIIAAYPGISRRRVYDAATGRNAGRQPEPAEMAERLPCASEEEWAEWDAINVSLYQSDQAGSLCDDCVADFALLMRAEGRCVGRPRGAEDEDATDDRRRPPGNLAHGPQRSAETRARKKAAAIARARELRQQGLSNVDVARIMGIKPGTVTSYVRAAS